MDEHSEHAPKDDRINSNRNFGLVFAAFFSILAFLPLTHGFPIRNWALAVSIVFAVMAFATPSLLAPLNRTWLRFGLLLHCIVSPIALGILFYGVATATGLLMRILGKDPLRLRMDKEAASYWIDRNPPGPAPESFRNQF